jgi:hypothetical protein
MANNKIIAMAAAILSSSATGCAEVESLVDTVVDSVDTVVDSVTEPASLQDRSPGEKIRRDASSVWSHEDCDKQTLPFFRLDLNDVSPASVRAGEKVSHRLQYSMCPNVSDGTIKGRLTTSIYYDTRKIHTDQVNNFEIKPGQWIVDTDVLVPERAKPGVYLLQVNFSSRETNFRDSTNFVVVP